jgi:hypothetical protein
VRVDLGYCDSAQQAENSPGKKNNPDTESVILLAESFQSTLYVGS